MNKIESERLSIEEATTVDSEFILELVNTPNWLRYIGDRNIHTTQAAENYIQNALMKSYQENSFGLYKLVSRDEGTSVGLCGLLQRDYLEFPDIGFAILPAFEGKGLVTEAAKCVLEDAANRLNIKTVQAITLPENYASQKVLEKVGLVLKEHIFRDGEKLLLYQSSLF